MGAGGSMRNWRRNGGEAIVLQSPILGTHFITPMGHTNSAHHLRAIALRVLQSPILGTHCITPTGHDLQSHQLHAHALRRVHSWLKKITTSQPHRSTASPPLSPLIHETSPNPQFPPVIGIEFPHFLCGRPTQHRRHSHRRSRLGRPQCAW